MKFGQQLDAVEKAAKSSEVVSSGSPVQARTFEALEKMRHIWRTWELRSRMSAWLIQRASTQRKEEECVW